jgi:hypothetical protein
MACWSAFSIGLDDENPPTRATLVWTTRPRMVSSVGAPGNPVSSA